MAPYTYAFSTEMRSFGKNLKASSNPANYDKAHATMAMDGKGNVWIAWHAGPEGSRDVYVARLDAQTRQFSEAVQLTDQLCRPVQSRPWRSVRMTKCRGLAGQQPRQLGYLRVQDLRRDHVVRHGPR